MGFDDLAELPAQPCLSSGVQTGTAIDLRDLTFIEAMETKLMTLVPAHVSVRCRITHGGVFIEMAENAPNIDQLEHLGVKYCAAYERHCLGVGPYRPGAAFLRAAR